uniref:Uncharacterized protein n=1 Tax=Anopheles gambiae TaxID=7165 RepID=A0A1S4GAM8_ANOGA
MSSKSTFFYELARKSENEIQATLMRCPSHITERDESERLLIHWAALVGQERLVESILERHPDQLNAEDDAGLTPLILATLGRHPAIVTMLTFRGRQRAPAQQARPFGAAVRLLEEPARHRTAPGAARRERGRGGLPERDAAAPGHRHRVDRADRAADRGGRQPEHTEQRGQHAPAHGLRGGQAGVCARAGAGRRQPGAAEPVRKDAARPGVPLAAPGAVRVGRK